MEHFKQQERGSNIFGDVSGHFQILFLAFQSFSHRNKILSGAISCCRGRFWGRGCDEALFSENGDCLGTPNPCSLSEKYWWYTSNLCSSTPPFVTLCLAGF